MNFGSIITAECVNVPPPPDPRCADPAFAIANPGICPFEPELIIKPGLALACVLGSVQFRAYTTVNGVETDVTAETIFSSGDNNIVVIGATSGNATGISAGETTITATRNGKVATAQVTILAGDNCCDGRTVAMMVMVDISNSMKAGPFGGSYQTRLHFAKAAAQRFISEVNYTKDYVGLMTFDAFASEVLAEPTMDKDAVAALVPTIAQEDQLTKFYDPLIVARDSLAAVTADLKVIILISDGESTADSTVPGVQSPFQIANDFKTAGGVIMCLGCRASGTGFAWLSSFSTGGFFVNALKDQTAEAMDYLSGLKGYICAGNCGVPGGGTTVGQGELDYRSFANWSVIFPPGQPSSPGPEYRANLIGNGFFDVLPGNGLYVELNRQWMFYRTGVDTATPIPLTAGKVYRLSAWFAGNQRQDMGIERIGVGLSSRVFNPDLESWDGCSIYATFGDFAHPFAEFSNSFTPSVSADYFLGMGSGYTGAARAFGPLVDRIKLVNVTDGVTILDETFDNENQVYIPPGCYQWGWLPDLNAYGYGGGGYCYGYGCLDEPIPIQLPDPTPIGTTLEAGYKPPQEYVCTKTAYATCPAGSSNFSTTNLVPVMTSNTAPSGVASSSGDYSTSKAFNAFDGYTAQGQANPAMWTWQSDAVACWLQYQFAAAQTVAFYKMFAYGAAYAPRDWVFQGSNDGSTWVTLDTQADVSWSSQSESKIYAVSTPAAYTYYRITVSDNNGGARTIIAELQMFGTAVSQEQATATARSSVSKDQACSDAYDEAYATAAGRLNCVPKYTSTLSYTAKCPLGYYGQDVTRSASAESYVSQAAADEKALALAKAAAEDALDCSQSNNEQAITINDALGATRGWATPYPSVKFVEGAPSSISTVKVHVYGLTHGSPQDICMLLRSPSGTIIVLMAGCGGFNAVNNPIDITFEDGKPAMTGALLVAGDYSPTDLDGEANIFMTAPPASAPLTEKPDGASLALFATEDANGPWSLWILDDLEMFGGLIAGGWDIEFTP